MFGTQSPGNYGCVPMETVKAWIINLERSAERRSYIDHAVAQYFPDLDHEFITAVDGRTLSAEDRTGLVDEEAVSRAPRWLSPGMIGCALSHLAVYRRVASSEYPTGLVLEDDVVLSEGIERKIGEIAEDMAGAEIVLLHFRSFEPCRFTRDRATPLAGGQLLAEPLDLSQPHSSGAYLLTREAAGRLADVVLPIRVAPDSWKYLRDAGGFDVLKCVVPYPIGVEPDFRTTLDHTLRAKAFNVLARYRLPPFHQAMRVYRSRRLRQWSQHVFMQAPLP